MSSDFCRATPLNDLLTFKVDRPRRLLSLLVREITLEANSFIPCFCFVWLFGCGCLWFCCRLLPSCWSCPGCSLSCSRKLRSCSSLSCSLPGSRAFPPTGPVIGSLSFEFSFQFRLF